MPNWQILGATAPGSSCAPNADRWRAEAVNGFLVITMGDGAYRRGKREHAPEGAQLAVNTAFETLAAWAQSQSPHRADDPALDDPTREVIERTLDRSIDDAIDSIHRAAANSGAEPATYGTTLGVGVFWREMSAVRVVGDVSFLAGSADEWRLLHQLFKTGTTANRQARNVTDLLPHEPGKLWSYVRFRALKADATILAFSDALAPVLLIDDRPDALAGAYRPNVAAAGELDAERRRTDRLLSDERWIRDTVESNAAARCDDTTLVICRPS